MGRRHVPGWALAGAVTLPDRAGTSGALVSSGGQLCLGWTGTDGRLNLLWSTDGRHFGNKSTLNHRSFYAVDNDSVEYMPPTLVATGAGVLMAWTGTNLQLNVMNLHRGPAAHTVLRQRSTGSPALGQVASHMVLAWTGRDRRLNVAYGRDGSFGAPFTLNQTSPHAPTIGALGDHVMVAWTGRDRRLNVAMVREGVAGAPLTLGATSSHSPAVCCLGDDLLVAWTGRDRRLNLVTMNARSGTSAPTVLGVTSSHAPALAVHEAQPMLVWTGTDHRLNVARLQRC